MSRLSYFEIVLIQLIVYVLIFLINDFAGLLVSIIISLVALVVTLISYFLEWVEPSRIPRSYFPIMWLTVLSPLLVLLGFAILFGLPSLQDLG
ncbi:MAG: hypothetical protein KTR24_08890 [Saprospiraceae bacterium]|nr:hypothetical protein [Saprospiraceae bacterium]